MRAFKVSGVSCAAEDRVEAFAYILGGQDTDFKDCRALGLFV